MVLHLSAAIVILVLCAKTAALPRDPLQDAVQWDTTVLMEQGRKCAHQEHLVTPLELLMLRVAVIPARQVSTVQQPLLVIQATG